MNPKHKSMIDKAIRKVPQRLKEDAFQAGCIGLVVGLNSSRQSENPDGYVYRCIKNEVIKEMATLNGLYALDSKTLIKLIKYKKSIAYGLNLESEGFCTATVEQLEKIINTREVHV